MSTSNASGMATASPRAPTVAKEALKSSGLVMVGTSNYNAWQFEQFQAHVGRTVLEIGCGVGNLTGYLVRHADRVVSIDVKPQAVAYTRQRFADEPRLTVEQRDIFADGLGPHAQAPFDTILFCNVLEHIMDDASAMAACHQILAPTRGKLLLLVPANAFLYGTIDEEVGHVRRYSANQIRALAAQGWKIHKLYPFNLIGALGWWANYCLLRRRGTNADESSTQTGFYDRWLVKPGRWWERRLPIPFGISYIAILEAI